jgi:hypothetical protein
VRRVALFLALLLVAGGCSYYNGMYNTKRLAGRARKAEKEGRTFDATTLWGQVGVKAESVLAQHPNSKWADEARLLQATSMSRLRDCASALRPLETLVISSSNPAIVEDANVLLGECRTTLGDAAGAADAYGRLIGSKDPMRRRRALFAHGRAQRMQGNYQLALEELAGTDQPGTAGERAAALAGLGRLEETSQLVDSLLSERDTLVPWDSLLAGAARHDPEAAARLTDRIVAEKDLPLGLRCRLLVADAVRWRPTDLARSDARLAQMERLAAGSLQAADARMSALRLELSEVDSLPALSAWATRAEDLAEGTGQVGPVALQLAGQARRMLQVADSVAPGAPNGDLRLFLGGEIARDSLGAPRLALRQFQRIVNDWPRSPFAAKALLALIPLEPARADSLQQVLSTSYAASPYLAMIENGASAEYEALEDSLLRFSLSFRPGTRRPGIQNLRPQNAPSTPAPTPAAPREPVNR